MRWSPRSCGRSSRASSRSTRGWRHASRIRRPSACAPGAARRHRPTIGPPPSCARASPRPETCLDRRHRPDEDGPRERRWVSLRRGGGPDSGGGPLLVRRPAACGSRPTNSGLSSPNCGGWPTSCARMPGNWPSFSREAWPASRDPSRARRASRDAGAARAGGALRRRASRAARAGHRQLRGDRGASRTGAAGVARSRGRARRTRCHSAAARGHRGGAQPPRRGGDRRGTRPRHGHGPAGRAPAPDDRRPAAADRSGRGPGRRAGESDPSTRSGPGCSDSRRPLVLALGGSGLGLLGVPTTVAGRDGTGRARRGAPRDPGAHRSHPDRVGGTAPLGAEERLARVPEGDQVRVEKYEAPGLPTRWIVYVGPTESFSPVASDEPWDLTSNFAGIAGLPAGSLRATELAMQEAGISEGDEVQFVGYSQGGLIAARLAGSDRWDAVSLETYGAPTGSVALPAELPGIAVRHTDDLVPALARPASALRPTPDRATGAIRMGDPFPTGEPLPCPPQDQLRRDRAADRPGGITGGTRGARTHRHLRDGLHEPRRLDCHELHIPRRPDVGRRYFRGARERAQDDADQPGDEAEHERRRARPTRIRRRRRGRSREVR